MSWEHSEARVAQNSPAWSEILLSTATDGMPIARDEFLQYMSQLVETRCNASNMNRSHET